MQKVTRCPVCGPLGTMGLLPLQGPMQAVPYTAPHWGSVESYRLVPVGTVSCYGCNGTGFVVADADEERAREIAAECGTPVERARDIVRRAKRNAAQVLAQAPKDETW